MERFAQAIVAGGIALVVGLWIATLATWGSAWWIGGVAVAGTGTLALAAGIWSEVEV